MHARDHAKITNTHQARIELRAKRHARERRRRVRVGVATRLHVHVDGLERLDLCVRATLSQTLFSHSTPDSRLSSSMPAAATCRGSVAPSPT
jgi:hypothetical protein